MRILCFVFNVIDDKWYFSWVSGWEFNIRSLDPLSLEGNVDGHIFGADNAFMQNRHSYYVDRTKFVFIKAVLEENSEYIKYIMQMSEVISKDQLGLLDMYPVWMKEL
jgi:hypothetical protein